MMTRATRFASLPLSFVAPTHEGQPSRQGQASRVFRAWSRRRDSRAKSDGLSPIPPGYLS